MSFDLHLSSPTCPCCGRFDEHQDWNITHNVNDIVDLALKAAGSPIAKVDSGYAERSWGRLNGWKAKDLIPVLEDAYRYLLDLGNAGLLRFLEPPNGWGTLDNVKEVMGSILVACRRNPQGIFSANG